MPDNKTLRNLYDREAWFEGGERGGYEDYDTQTAPSLPLVSALLDRLVDKPGLSVLDVGCGYGTHLALAAERQWKCFGVEPSAHAREIAAQRHGERMTIAERVEDLLPLRFDLILMLEVIEHLKDPYGLFFTLFGRGMIGPDTIVVITTPNARSNDAVADPANWAYRHPPSHLVYYSAKSLDMLLRRLMFKDVNIRGVVPLPRRPTARFEDEAPSINDELGEFTGLVAEASGSDFKEFMHERYVPGAYWKLTEYEHLPRYRLASHFAQDSRVLDFGCGTGYGAARLALVAESVIGLDISAEALDWARQMHRNPRLVFERRSDLGRGLPPASFDLVTCFEMIEHVDFETQKAVIRSIADLLKPAGKLVISTPDPRFTADYGDNPYHLREMTEAEFMALLEPRFKHVTLFKHWVRPSIFIGTESVPGERSVVYERFANNEPDDIPVGYVAICSHQPFDAPPQLCQFDTSSDFNFETLQIEHRLNRLRFEKHQLAEQLKSTKVWLEGQVQATTDAWNIDKVWLEGQVRERDQALGEIKSKIQRSLPWRILRLLRLVPPVISPRE